MTREPVRRQIRTYEDLEVYQRSMDLLKPIHDLALRLPDYEKYDLASQMRRAAKSIPANIVEGYAKRRSAKEFQAYLTNALGSANEMEAHLKVALRLEYIDQELARHFIEQYRIIGRQLFRLIEHWRTFDRAQLPSSSLSSPTEER